MAEHSKEYDCDFADFSIKEIFENLEEDHYKPEICEGFGFVAIAKDGGACKVAMPQGDETIKWHEFCFETKTILPYVHTKSNGLTNV